MAAEVRAVSQVVVNDALRGRAARLRSGFLPDGSGAMPRTSAGRGRLAGRLLGIAAVGWIVVLTALTRRFFMDDAYIGFRCVENLLAGRGFVFNPGEYVESVTNIGWLLTLAGLGWLMPVPLAAKTLGALSLLAVAWLVDRLAVRAGGEQPDPLLRCGAVLLTLTQAELVYFPLIGMETGLLAVGLCLLVFLGRRKHDTAGFAVLGAALYTIHPEAVLVYPLGILLVLMGERGRWRRYVRGASVFALTVAAITAARFLYFGDLLPNTFTAKASGSGDFIVHGVRLLNGANVNVPAPLVGLFTLPFFVAGLIAFWRDDRRSGAFLLAALLTGVAFGVYSQPDWTGLARYYAPYVGLTVLVFWRGFVVLSGAALMPAAGARVGRLCVVGCLGLFVFAGLVRTVGLVRPPATTTYPGYVLTSVPLVEPALWVGAHVPAGSVVATRRIGALAYYADVEIFDYKFGLPHRDVALAIRDAGREFNNPRDAALAGLWAARDPDYVLEEQCILDLALSEGESADRFALHGVTYGVVKRFVLGQGNTWVLCARVAGG